MSSVINSADRKHKSHFKSVDQKLLNTWSENEQMNIKEMTWNEYEGASMLFIVLLFVKM